jgi:hypothetical protein
LFRNTDWSDGDDFILFWNFKNLFHDVQWECIRNKNGAIA